YPKPKLYNYTPVSVQPKCSTQQQPAPTYTRLRCSIHTQQIMPSRHISLRPTPCPSLSTSIGCGGVKMIADNASLHAAASVIAGIL
ncbi:unnamed protein product, partial [Ceratitis capitata]